MRTLLFLFVVFFFTACDEYNSNSADKLRYDEGAQQETDTGDANFASAFAVIEKRCISCHSGQHDNWASYRSDDAWINSGEVHRGDPDNSPFIKRIINSGLPNSNMPEGLGALPDAEYQLLRKWISEMP